LFNGLGVVGDLGWETIDLAVEPGRNLLGLTRSLLGIAVDLGVQFADDLPRCPLLGGEPE